MYYIYEVGDICTYFVAGDCQTFNNALEAVQTPRAAALSRAPDEAVGEVS